MIIRAVSSTMRSIRNALAGLRHMLLTQHNARIHLAATVAAVAAGIGLRIAPEDWRWLIVAMALVWSAEALNTAFEHLCDAVAPEYREPVKRAKDIAAGAVLVCAIGALGLGISVFWPYLKAATG